MLPYILKFTNLFLLLAATAWLTHEPSWEPLIIFITLLSGSIVQEIKDQRSRSFTKDTVEHDKSIFLKYEAILSESDLKDAFNHDISNGRVDQNFTAKLSTYLHNAESIENTFLHSEINAKFQEFKNSLSSTRNIIANSFFHLENKPELKVYFLYPDIKNGEKRNIYQKKLNEINTQIDKTIEDYDSFRMSVKSVLYM